MTEKQFTEKGLQTLKIRQVILFSFMRAFSSASSVNASVLQLRELRMTKLIILPEDRAKSSEIERFKISCLPKTREIYILPVSHSYGASTKNREIS